MPVVPRTHVPPRSLFGRLRTFALACLSALAGFGLASSPGCGTDAKGIEDCRDIERARCSAGVACGIVTDVEACQRFYRDHCLHGMATLPPSPTAVDECVETINAAGSCVNVSDEGKLAPLRGCEAAPGVLDAASSVLYACELVEKPELARRCSFLTSAPFDDGEGGASGAGN
jgi:hypothetical protein